MTRSERFTTTSLNRIDILKRISLSLSALLVLLYAEAPYAWAMPEHLASIAPQENLLKPKAAADVSSAKPRIHPKGPTKLIEPVINFSQNPTDLDIYRTRILPERMRPVSDKQTPAENAALADLILKYKAQKDRENFAVITNFLEKYPASRWAPAVQLNLGLLSFQYGYLTNALSYFEKSWKGFKGAPGRPQQKLAVKAAAELAALNSRLGRLDSLKETLSWLDTQKIPGYCAFKVQSARESAAMMKTAAAVSFRCGPCAVRTLLALDGPQPEAIASIIKGFSSTSKGTNFQQVKELADRVGLKYQLAKRSGNAPLVVPAIMHWRLGHFATITKKMEGGYQIKDPTFGKEGGMLVSQQAIDRESDGYFLVPIGRLPSGWSSIDEKDASAIWGKGLATGYDNSNTCPVPSDGGGGGGCPSCHGMPVASVLSSNCVVKIHDSPLGYSVPIGPSMDFTANYNSISSEFQADSNFGEDWSFNWGSILQRSGGGAAVNVPGGGFEGFSAFLDPNLLTQAMLSSKSGPVYSRVLTDGTSQNYALSDGTNYHLTSIADPQGNEAVISYDANYRVTSIADACGNPPTTVTYESNTVGGEGFNCIKTITDGFGRTASFTYDQYFTQLLSITDAAGNVSSFVYDTTYVYQIDSMTTPYGNTSFNFTNLTTNGNFGRQLIVTYPDNSTSVTLNYIIETKDTYYWDREAMSLYPTDYQNGIYSHCKRTHWLYEPDEEIESPVPAYEQNALEGVTGYTYAGRQDVYSVGAINKPSTVTRMLSGNRVINANVFAQSGTLNPGDYSQLTFDDAGLPGGTLSVKYNTVQGDTAATIATALANLINSNSTLKALGITARTYLSQAEIVIQSLSPNVTRVLQYTTFPNPNYDAGERISLLLNPNLATNATLGGTIKSGDTVSLTISDSGISGGPVTVTSTVTGSSTLATIAANLSSQINANANLQAAFITSTNVSGSPTLTINSMSVFSTTYSASTSVGATETIALNANAQVWSYLYNELGKPTQSIDPIGRTFSTSYTSDNIDVTQIMETKGTDAYVLGTWTYGNAAWPHRATMYQDGSNQLWQYAYNSFSELTTSTDPNNNTTTSSYNAEGYLTEVQGPLAGTKDVTTYTYYPYGPVHTLTDSEGYVLTYSYDNLNRQTQTLYPDGSTENTIYNRLDAILTSDRDGRWTQSQYDVLDQLVAQIDPLSRKTQYSWCVCGAMATLTDPAGNTTSWNHDLEGRVVGKTYSDGTTESTVYDPYLGRVATKTDPLGQITTFGYYADNTVASKTYSNAKNPIGPTTYAYDQNFPRISSAANSSNWGSINYLYYPYITNPSGPPTTGAGKFSSVISNNGTYASSTVTYSYDSLGRVSNRAITGTASTSTPSYDAMSRNTGETNELGAFKYNYVDDMAGSSKGTTRLSSVNYPNGQSTNFSYYGNTGDQRLLQISNLSPSSTTLSQFNYSYDSVDQLTQWPQLQNGTSQFNSLTYDAAGQLSGVQTGNGAPATGLINQKYYSYDVASNRRGVQTNVITRARLSGAITSGDVLSIVVADSGLTNGSTTVSYAIKSTDTLANVASNLAELITANSSLQGIGVNAVASSNFLLIQSVSPNLTTYSYTVTTGGTEAVTFGSTNNFKEQIVVGGTATASDVLTITVHDTALTGGSEAVKYTVVSGNSLTSIATGIAAAINADTKLQSLGVTSTAHSTVVNVASSSSNATTYVSSINTAATETLTPSINPNGIYKVGISGTATASNVLTLNVFDAALSGGTTSVAYTVKSGDTLTTIASGLAASVNASTALQGIGATATSTVAVVSISSDSPNLTDYRQTTSSGSTEVLTAPVPANGVDTIAVGGTIKAADVLSVAAFDTGLTGGSQTAGYTVKTGDTTTTVATGLAAAINANASLQALGISATSLATVVNVSSSSLNATTYATSLSGGATETLFLAPTIGCTQFSCNNVNSLTSTAPGGPVHFQATVNKALQSAHIGPALLSLYSSSVDATTYSASSTGAETISFGTTQNGLTIGTLAGAVASGNVVSLKVNNSSLSGGTTTVTYTVKSGDTLYTIGDGLTSAVNTSSSLQTIGVNSSAPADASYLWSGNFSGSTPLNPGLNTTAVTAVDGAGNTLANNYNLHVNTGSSSALTYDANGNLATKPGATYAFDPENRLQSISFSTNPATQTAFSYDALGRLAMITLSQSGTVTNRKLYVWSGNQIIQERNQTGTATKDYYSLGENRAGTDYFYSKDHLGSIRELTNSSGSVQAQYSYDPYGQATQLQGTLVCDFQFTGVYYEPTSNFNLMVHRAYSSSLGRFISRDPSSEFGGINLFAYTMNNPLTRTDPSGLAYFASGPLDLLFGIWFGTFSQNPIDDFFNTELSHEQLFFEDGKDPKNIGWGPDGNFTVDNVQNYHPKPGHYDDCIMRQAEKSIQWSGSSYWLIGKNCQTWADAVRKAYADLQSNGSAQSQCCE